MPDPGLRLLFSTAPPDVAEELARGLLEAKLIACANLLPNTRSLYWWEGAITCDTEVSMIMETSAALADEAVETLDRAHPYDVPKILVFSPESAPPAFLDWLRASTVAR